MAIISIQKIIDAAKTTVPAFDYINALARHVKSLYAATSALQLGSAPSFGTALDLRYYAEDVGAENEMEIVPQQEPESGDALVGGMYYFVKVAVTNTDAVTLTVRNTDDDFSITKDVKDKDGSPLAGGELVTNQFYRLLYVTDGASVDEWRIVGQGTVVVDSGFFNFQPGGWSPGTHYLNDVRTHNGSSWVVINSPTNEEPGTGADWEQIAAKGADGDMMNPMTAAGDMIIGGASGAPARLAIGTAGLHMRAGSSGPEYGGDVDMGQASLMGHTAPKVTINSATNLHPSNHLAALMSLDNATLTIEANSTTSFPSGFQCILFSTHASGGTITAASGVGLNGVDGGSATIDQYEMYALYRDASDSWILGGHTGVS